MHYIECGKTPDMKTECNSIKEGKIKREKKKEDEEFLFFWFTSGE